MVRLAAVVLKFVGLDRLVAFSVQTYAKPQQNVTYNRIGMIATYVLSLRDFFLEILEHIIFGIVS